MLRKSQTEFHWWLPPERCSAVLAGSVRATLAAPVLLQIDVLAFLKNPDRLIGIERGENFVAHGPKFTGCEHVYEGFVLDHEYATRH